MKVRPLRRILSLQALFTAVVPFLLVALLGFLWVLPQVRSDVEGHQRELAKAIGSQIGSYLSSALADVRAVASLPLHALSSSKDLHRMLEAQIQGSSALSLIYTVTPDGRVASAGIGQEHESGKHDDLEGLDLSRNALFNDALRLKRPVWSDTFFSIVGGRLSVAVAVPTEQMVTIGEIDLGKLTEFLKRTAAGAGQQVLVIDGRGQVIADQNGVYTAQQLNLSNIPLIRKGLASGEPVSGQFELDGRKMVGSFARNPELQWDILVAQPVELAFRAALTTTGIVAAGLVVALLIGTGASLFLSRRLSIRFEGLANYARKIARGGEAPELPEGGVTEVEQLALDLSRMAEAIRKRERQLLESEMLLRSVMDQAFQYQALLAPDGTVVEVNRSALDLIGVMKGAVVGRYYWDTPWWSHDAGMQVRLRSAVGCCASGQFIRFETCHVDRAGRVHHVDLSLNPMLDDAGKVLFLIAEGRDITEIKLAKLALELSESRLQLYFRRLPIASIVCGVDGRVQQWNPQAERVFGYAALQAVGRVPCELIVAASMRDEAMRVWRIVAAGGMEISTISENVTRDGKAITCSWTNTPLHDKDGKVVGVISLAEDITERRRTDALLQESEERFRLMFRNHNAVMLLIDPATGAIIDANNAACSYYGYSHDAICSLNLSDLTGMCLDAMTPRMNDIMEGKKHSVISRTVLASRELRNVEVHASKIDIQGRQLFFAVLHDVTERIRMEADLLKLSRALEQIPVAILITGLAGNIEYSNPRFSRMAGYTPDEAKSLTLHTLVSLLPSREEYQSIREKITRGGIWEGEFCTRKKSGESYWVSASISPIFSQEGEITHFVVIEEDITEKKRVSEQLLLNNLRFQNLYELSLMRDQPEERLLDFALDGAVRITGSSIGYIFFLNPDETVLTLGAWSRTVMQECNVVNPPDSYLTEETGLWGEAVRRRAPVITNHYVEPAPGKKGPPEGHVALTRHVNVPLLDNGKIVLLVGVGNKEGDYDDSDVLQLTLLMTAMWRILQERKAERSLQESEHNYRLLFNNMTAGFALHEIICDEAGRPADYRYLQINPAFEQITGVPANSLLGRTVKEILPQIEDHWIETFGKVALTGEQVAYENYSQALKKYFKTWAFRPRKNQFAVIFTDTTEHHRSTEALKQSEDRFRQIFSQNDDAIVLIHLKSYRIIDANLAALELYGVTYEELPSLKPWDFFDKMQVLRIMRGTPRENLSEGITLQKVVSMKANGEKFLVSLKAKVIYLRDEEVILCSIRDITRKIGLEEEVRAAQAKLIHSNKMTSLGMLVSSVAHEINNPNHCISINNSVLTKIWQDLGPHLQRIHEADGNFMVGGLRYEEIRELVPQLQSGILDGSRRISNIVKDMKDYVKPEKLVLEGAIDVNKAVQGASSILWHHIQKHTERYRTDLAESLPQVRGSRQQIEQVVINLIMNALQSLPDKSGEVMVRTSLDSGGETVSITVQDQGVGMSPEVMNRLTEPFFTMRIDKGGTGLGLYTSASIIREHRGALEFTSEAGSGTTATIRLPVADSSLRMAAAVKVG